MERELAKLAAQTEAHQAKSLRLGELRHLVEQDLGRSGPLTRSRMLTSWTATSSSRMPTAARFLTC